MKHVTEFIFLDFISFVHACDVNSALSVTRVFITVKIVCMYSLTN